MYKVKKSSNPFYIESNQAFRQVFLTNLNKLSETATKKTGLDEIRDLLINHVQDADRINLVLTLLSETGDHQKATGKRESMKVIGLMAEVFEDRLAGYLPKILNIMSKKLKENDPQVHDTLSASLGNLVNFTLRNLDMDTAYKSLESIFQMLFQLCSKGNRYTQIGAAMCVTKTIQSCSFEFLYLMVEDISSKIIEVLRQHTCKAHIQLFECLLSLILVFEGNSDKLHESAKHILPVTIDNLTNGDWNVRKIAVEVIYTLSVIIPEAIIPYKHEILEVLGHCRFDKIKNVRESATTAITRIKELGDPDVPVKLISYQEDEVGDDAEHMGTATFNTKTYTNESDIYQSNTFRGSEIHSGSRLGGHSQSVRARSSPQREKSTSRMPLKMNPEFFSNAPKHRGDIEIYTKSPPPKSLLIEPESGGSASKLKTGRGEPQVEVHTSPNRTFKYIITGQNQTNTTQALDTEPETNYVQGYDHRQEQQQQRQPVEYEPPTHEKIENETEARESIVSTGGLQKTRTYRDEEKEIREERASMENSRQMVEEAPKRHENSGDKRLTGSAEKRRQQSDAGVYDDYSSSSRPKPRATQSNDDFSAVFKQLANISEQQSTMMQSLTTFQENTYKELEYLKNRVKHLEDFIQTSHHPPKSTPNYPPYHHAPPHGYPPYMSPYQPYGQAPMYPVQYSNYVPPGYPQHGPPQGPQGQGVDTRRRPETSRPENGQNFSSSSRGGADPSGYGSQTQGRASTAKSSKDKGAVSYPGQRMEQEYSSTTRERTRQESRWENKDVGRSQNLSSTTRDDRSHIKNSPQQRGRRSARKQALWDKIQEDIRRNDVASAYEVCLNEGDEETLIDLMHETGNIVDQLDCVLVENLLVNMKSRIFDEENRDMMLNWVENTLQKNIQVSRGTFIALHDVIVQLLGEGAKVSTLQQQRVKKLVNELQTYLDDTMPVEKNLNREMDQTENLGDEEIDEGTENNRMNIK